MFPLQPLKSKLVEAQVQSNLEKHLEKKRNGKEYNESMKFP